MTGVEILSSQTIYETEYYGWLIVVGAGAGFLVCLIASIIDWVDTGFDASHISLIFVSALIGTFIGIIGAVMSEHKTDTVNYIEYKVTIDDSVSMNEFLDKYEILDQEGKIYTVKERNNEENSQN